MNSYPADYNFALARSYGTQPLGNKPLRMSCVDLFGLILGCTSALSVPESSFPSPIPPALSLTAHLCAHSFLLTPVAPVFHFVLPNFASPLDGEILFLIPPRRDGKEKDKEETVKPLAQLFDVPALRQAA